MKETAVYAIVRSGSKQQKVAVGDVIEIDKVETACETLTLPVVMVVDGASVADAQALESAAVTAEGARRLDVRDRDREVQEQDRLQEAPGPPPEVHPGQGDRDLRLTGGGRPGHRPPARPRAGHPILDITTWIAARQRRTRQRGYRHGTQRRRAASSKNGHSTT